MKQEFYNHLILVSEEFDAFFLSKNPDKIIEKIMDQEKFEIHYNTLKYEKFFLKYEEFKQILGEASDVNSYLFNLLIQLAREVLNDSISILAESDEVQTINGAKIFVVSSSNQITNGLLQITLEKFHKPEHNVICNTWDLYFNNQNGLTYIQTLMKAIEEHDHAVCIFGADDIIIQNEIQQENIVTKNIVRDNVLFEAGLFMAKIRPKNVFIITPSDIEMHIASDLLGLNRKYYNSNDTNTFHVACNQIISELHQRGLVLNPW